MIAQHFHTGQPSPYCYFHCRGTSWVRLYDSVRGPCGVKSIVIPCIWVSVRHLPAHQRVVFSFVVLGLGGMLISVVVDVGSIL